MIYFAAIESNFEMNFDTLTFLSYDWDVTLNGVGNNDEPDDYNPDNGNPNPFDHGRHPE